MIVCEVKPLAVSEENILRRWLDNSAADILIKVLKSDAAKLQIEALSEIEKVSLDVSRGAPIPQPAQAKFKQAAAIAAAIKILQDKIKDGSELTQANPIIE